jgi:hypothetical protein
MAQRYTYSMQEVLLESRHLVTSERQRQFFALSLSGSGTVSTCTELFMLCERAGSCADIPQLENTHKHTKTHNLEKNTQ